MSTSKIIYIIDDEALSSHLLKQILNTIDPAWQVTTFQAQATVLDALRKQAPHVLIADQEIHRAQGSEVLEFCRHQSPTTIRILMDSGLCIGNKLSAAHQYIAKPFDIDDINLRLHSALNAQEELQNLEVAKFVSQLSSFPVIPGALDRVLRALRSPDSDLDEVARLIANDGGMLTKLIQAANSPLFGTQTPITTGFDALQQLGSNNAVSMLLSLNMFQTYEAGNPLSTRVQQVWKQSWQVAQLVQKLGEVVSISKTNASEAFFAGLMYNLGQLVLIDNQPQAYAEVLAKSLTENLPLAKTEQQVLGIQSSVVAVFILKLWGMSAKTVEAVTWYNQPWKTKGVTPATLLYIADRLTGSGLKADLMANLNAEYLKTLDLTEAVTALLNKK